LNNDYSHQDEVRQIKCEYRSHQNDGRAGALASPMNAIGEQWKSCGKSDAGISASLYIFEINIKSLPLWKK
jgi:hypothetical protein